MTASMSALSRLRPLLFAGLLWLAAAPSAQAQFVGGIDDLPLMPGLAAVTGADLVFETPAGRIVEAMAVMPEEMTADAVRDFYDRTLPQLGWQVAAAGEYRREGEVLSLEFTAGPPPAVRFRLAPAR